MYKGPNTVHNNGPNTVHKNSTNAGHKNGAFMLITSQYNKAHPCDKVSE